MEKQPSIFGGACIIASVCVGAGMLGLPSAGAGPWTIWTMIVLVGTMIVLTWAGWLLLEAYKNYDLTASYNTVTKDLMGPGVNVINNIAFYFLGGILLYAYTTASGGILYGMLGKVLPFGEEFGPRICSIIFVFVFSAVVWHSTRLVDRLSSALVIIMALSFLLGASGLTVKIDMATLFNTGSHQEDTRYALYAISLLPVAFTSFGYQHAASSIREYYGDEVKAKKAMLGGTLIALGLYVFWLVSIFGNLPRPDFIPVVKAGGNVEALLEAMSDVIDSNTIKQSINIFSMAAILSSFVGVGLGVFHFFSDFFHFSHSKIDRTKSWAITFMPPLVMSLIAPMGFVKAIGYAGAVSTICGIIMPALMVWKVRQRGPEWQKGYRVAGGNFVIAICIIWGVAVAVIHLMAMNGAIPTYGA